MTGVDEFAQDQHRSPLAAAAVTGSRRRARRLSGICRSHRRQPPDRGSRHVPSAGMTGVDALAKINNRPSLAETAIVGTRAPSRHHRSEAARAVLTPPAIL
jgi:hypothetical protein